MPDLFIKPPHIKNEAGETRSVGFEIEFAAQDCVAIARKVADLFGGNLEKENPHYYKIRNSRLGDFSVQLDTQIAHPENSDKNQISESELEHFLKYEALQTLCEIIGDLGKAVVPYEVITPPIPVDRLADLNTLIGGLIDLGVEGTDESLFYAFGVHINPEAPSLKVDSILAHLRAFVLLSDWLQEKIQVNITRKISPYINAFPRSYCVKILDAGYRPSMEEFIDDYLADNPTRNRELDLLPLLTHIDRERVQSQLDDTLTSARPTYHYRLPDCRLNDPGWSLSKEWNLWVEVEKLAANEDSLQTLSLKYIDLFGEDILANWIAELRKQF